jgi:SNF2 family DNA or RNA helicase
MVIIDEAHTLLKKESSQISKRLGPIRTKRRIILSGTPFVNNLGGEFRLLYYCEFWSLTSHSAGLFTEYYQLADWVRPGVFGAPSQFERKYIKPITAGLASDSSIQAVALQVQRSQQLFAEIAPFMQRRDIAILKRDLPPCQTAVLYIRQTKLQTRLYREFDRFAKKLKDEDEELPFITQYQTLRPLHNHPYCLLQSARGIAKRDSIKKDKQRKAEAAASCVKMEAINQTMRDQRSNANKEDAVVDLLDSESEEGLPGSGRTSPVEPAHEDGKPAAGTKPGPKSKAKRGRRPTDFSWMESIVTKVGEPRMESVACGNKIFLLLQILANAQSVGDKVVVFSQCLKTLDFIERVLKKDWASYCHGYEEDRNLGNWRKGVDYLRIDGGVNSSERGELVASFHAEYESHKLFLLSIEAGGIG